MTSSLFSDMAPRGLPLGHRDEHPQSAAIVPEPAAKVKSESRRCGWEVSATGRKARCCETSGPAEAHVPS